MFEYLFSHCLAPGPTDSDRDPWTIRTRITLLEMFLFTIPVQTEEAHCGEKNNSEIPYFLFQRYLSWFQHTTIHTHRIKIAQCRRKTIFCTITLADLL